MSTNAVTETKVKHTFSIFVNPGAKLSITSKMARAIEETVNRITKHVDVVQLPVDQFEHLFLVRMNTNSKILDKEFKAHIIAHWAHISLKCEVEGKKIIMFGLWKRLKKSEVLI